MADDLDPRESEEEEQFAATAGSSPGRLPDYQARTPLGRRLWEIRTRLVASGVRLLDWEEIDLEIAERRGRDDEHVK